MQKNFSATSITPLTRPIVTQFKLLKATVNKREKDTSVLVEYVTVDSKNQHSFTQQLKLQRYKSNDPTKAELMDRLNNNNDVIITFMASRFVEAVTKELNSYSPEGLIIYTSKNDSLMDTLFTDTDNKKVQHENFSDALAKIINENLIGSIFTLKVEINISGTFVSMVVKQPYFNSNDMMVIVQGLGLKDLHNDILPFTDAEKMQNSTNEVKRITILSNRGTSNQKPATTATNAAFDEVDEDML